MSDRYNTSWTTDRIEAMRGMIAKGYTSAVVAAALGGVSRNAVIGKAIREGIQRPMQTRPNKVHKLNLRAARKPIVPRIQPPTVAAPMPMAIAADTARVSLMALSAGHCRFPVGDNPGPNLPHFCGLESLGGQPYCAHHHARCNVGAPKTYRAPGHVRNMRVRALEYA